MSVSNGNNKTMDLINGNVVRIPLRNKDDYQFKKKKKRKKKRKYLVTRFLKGTDGYEALHLQDVFKARICKVGP